MATVNNAEKAIPKYWYGFFVFMFLQSLSSLLYALAEPCELTKWND
jgi:hypothetical protein